MADRQKLGAARIASMAIVPIAASVVWTVVGPSLAQKLDPFFTALGAWAVVAFIGLGSLAAVLCAPMSFVYLTGGALFGLGFGALCNAALGAIGSCAAFALARTTLGKHVARLLATRSRLERFERALSERAVWLCALLRLSPFLPLGPLSYALGASRVSTRAFLLTLPALFPTPFAFAYAGHAASLLLDPKARARSPLEWVVFGAGLAATAGATYLIGRAALRALGREHRPA